MVPPPIKKRKVRKGTHSCCECRRRKIRCKFAEDDDKVCLGCRGRDAPCISQELAPESPAAIPDRRVTERVSKLERMLERLVNQSATSEKTDLWGEQAGSRSPPDEETQSPRSPRGSRPLESSSTTAATKTTESMGKQQCKRPSDLMNSSAAGNALTALGHTSPSTPSLITPTASPTDMTSTTLSVQPKTPCHFLSRKIHALIPSRETLSALASKVPGVPFLFSIVHGPDPSFDSCPVARPEDIVHIPSPTSHPALLSRKLLTVCFCLQQLPYDFDMSTLHCSRSAVDIINEAMAVVTREVTCNDEMLTCLEGIECLMLQSLIYSDAGLIRKAWMTGRRALSIQQLMGLDRQNATGPIRSCDPDSDPARRPPPGLLWFRVNSSDRYNSLVLGLPTGSRDNSFAKQEFPEWDVPLDKLGRAYAVIAGKISRRNEADAEEEYGEEAVYNLTQAIDAELNAAADIVSEMWWDRPGMIRECSESDNFMPELSTVKLQVRHFTLLIILHLPYLLRQQQRMDGDERYLYNCKRCMDASRAVIKRFLEFRKSGAPVTSGRSVDYSALVACMTIVVGHGCLRNRSTNLLFSSQIQDERGRDRELVQRARDIMTSAGKQWGDRLALESGELLEKLLSRSACPGAGNVLDPCSSTATVNGETLPSPSLLDSFAQSGAATVSGTLDLLREGPTMMQTDADWSWLGSSADLDEWALQGPDSMYWSLLNQGA